MKFGIIGAGPSGLSMAKFIRYPSLVFERSSSPGGHAGSFADQGYTFDHGPHIMFSKNKTILSYMVASLGKNVHVSKRNNKISYKGKLIKYPFENDLQSLPIEDNYECLYTYLFNPYKEKFINPQNFKQWLLKHFGKGICEKYLFPYNRKVWNIPVHKLSMLWADRLPNPPKEDIIKSAIGFNTEGYIHQLHYNYPLRGGYQAISDAWTNGIEIKYQTAIKSIHKSGDTFLLSDGKNQYSFDQIISTMPIHELVKILQIKIPVKVKKAIKNLIVNPMFVISLGIKGKDTKKYTALYFPEEDFLVNRISFPATFSPLNAPKGHYSIQAEITCRKHSKEWKMSDQEIINHTIEGLVKRKIIPSKKNISYINIKRHPYAYVVYDTDYEKNVKIIRDWFPKQGIHLVGRFSYFEYINVDGVVATALKIASKINKQEVRVTEDGKVIK